MKNKTSHPDYFNYANMVQRVYNKNHPDYKYYKAMDIKVCDEWLGKEGFENFLEDMGPRPKGLVLDRIDTTKDYCKENCHYITQKENTQNSKGSKWWYIHDHRFPSSQAAADVLGVSHTTIRRMCGERKDLRGDEGCYAELKYPQLKGKGL